MTLFEAGEALAEMCYTHVYPLDYDERVIAHDFAIEVDLMKNEPDYLNNISEGAQQFCADVVKIWSAASEVEQKRVIGQLLENDIIPQKDE